MSIMLGRKNGGSMRSGGRGVFLVVLVLALAGVRPAASRAEGLDRELLRQAPAVLRYLKDHGYRNAGVLKFRVKKGDEPVSDRAGPLNLNLATRLEVALVLADDVRDPLGIIHDASAVAVGLPDANHLTAPGRRALFRTRYPLAWGDQEVEPDAFLTGVVVVRPDLRTLIVSIQAFGKDGGALDEVAQLTATTDAPTLVEIGESFLIRGGFDDGRTEVVPDPAAVAARVKAEQQANPLQDTAAPVALEIHYGGRPFQPEIRGGRALIPEPRQGQQVRFVLRKVDSTPDRYGVVLLVNGENTLFKERLCPSECHKWVLSRDRPAVTVRGYQSGEQTAEAFRVLSPAESRRNVMHYGPDMGTISLVVFRERKGAAAPPLNLDEEADDLAAITRGAFPQERPQTLAALKFQLHEGAAQSGSRGLIAEGEQIGAVVRRVEYQPDPKPVMSATITYYKP